MASPPPPTLLLFLTLLLAACAPSQQVAPGGARGPSEAHIRVNQIGYYPDAPKLAAVVGTAAESFRVVPDEGGEAAFTGVLGPARVWPPSGEEVRIANFSALRAPGTYRIALDDGSVSHPFRVEENAHREVARAALKAFYFQRVSTALPERYAGPWARPAGHPDTSVAVHPSAATPARPTGTVIAAPRGWYDAGDYNKYVVNSGISTYQVLAVYEHFPEFASQFTLDIPESGGPLPDVLAEALWNVRWMLAMQDPEDGGVYHKLTTARFEDAVMPHEAVSQRYVVQKSTAAALNFAAVMAQASRVLSGYESALPGLSDSLRVGAVRAWGWAREHPYVYYDQNAMNAQHDPDVVTGAYGDGDVSDEFAWAATELSITTGDPAYLASVEEPFAGLDVPNWASVRALGAYSLLHHREHLKQEAPVEEARAALLAAAEALRASYDASAYRVTMGGSPGDFVWGSNAVAANQSMLLLQAYRLTGEARYLEAALANLDYLLGRNATGYAFVTGHGARTPLHPHHRPSEADGVAAPVPGLLVGGPNPGQQDLEYCSEYEDGAYPSALPGLSYIDHWCSYAANEIAINWNAPLAYVAVALEALLGSE